jgi:hypothetical protein
VLRLSLNNYVNNQKNARLHALIAQFANSIKDKTEIGKDICPIVIPG